MDCTQTHWSLLQLGRSDFTKENTRITGAYHYKNTLRNRQSNFAILSLHTSLKKQLRCKAFIQPVVYPKLVIFKIEKHVNIFLLIFYFHYCIVGILYANDLRCSIWDEANINLMTNLIHIVNVMILLRVKRLLSIVGPS